MTPNDHAIIMPGEEYPSEADERRDCLRVATIIVLAFVLACALCFFLLLWSSHGYTFDDELVDCRMIELTETPVPFAPRHWVYDLNLDGNLSECSFYKRTGGIGYRSEFMPVLLDIDTSAKAARLFIEFVELVRNEFRQFALQLDCCRVDCRYGRGVHLGRSLIGMLNAERTPVYQFADCKTIQLSRAQTEGARERLEALEAQERLNLLEYRLDLLQQRLRSLWDAATKDRLT